jgi:hypothetical protein
MPTVILGEIDRADGRLVHVAEQPFLPEFPPDYRRAAVDLTGLDPMPEPGWVWLGPDGPGGGRGFRPPAPGEFDAPEDP